MHTSSKLKREFITKWAKGLQICCSSKKKMDVFERKKKIKLSADIAMASAKNATSSWSIALISNAKRDTENNLLLNNILDTDSTSLVRRSSIPKMIACHKRIRSKKILKKSCSVGQRMKKMGPPKSNLATYIAKRLIKKRTQVLKTLVPGGESMDEFSLLINEALDYILSLKVQVNVMRKVANATEALNQSNSKVVE